jgi:hypothetical protein
VLFESVDVGEAEFEEDFNLLDETFCVFSEGIVSGTKEDSRLLAALVLRELFRLLLFLLLALCAMDLSRDGASLTLGELKSWVLLLALGELKSWVLLLALGELKSCVMLLALGELKSVVPLLLLSSIEFCLLFELLGKREEKLLLLGELDEPSGRSDNVLKLVALPVLDKFEFLFESALASPPLFHRSLNIFRVDALFLPRFSLLTISESGSQTKYTVSNLMLFNYNTKDKKIRK